MSGSNSFSFSRTEPSPKKLTLVLPPLNKTSSLSGASKTAGKTVSRHARTSSTSTSTKKKAKGKERERGPPRPPKLRPLKEVLTRVIGTAQKKDAYGFFLKPVDLAAIPGYLDTIKRPMDFGTISSKVARGKYRSLEEFADDMRLVTFNAKLFNPPGSIYYTEADRLEHWANDQIVKAATTVIEDGADYDLNVEGDDAEEEHDEDDNLQSALPMTPVQEHSILETSPTAMVMDEDLQAIHAAAAYPPGRRPPQRAAVKKIEQERAKDMEKEKEKDKLTERVVDNELDDNDHMPGYKFGIGAFPAGDHWNEVMYALKLKDKRYKTKKERLRIEKDGLPHAPDGSLNYWEIEDPWTVLQSLVPEPRNLPQVEAVYPASSNMDPTQTTLAPPAHVFIPSIVPSAPAVPSEAAASSTTTTTAGKKRKYWTLGRTNGGRGARKDREDTTEPTPAPESTSSRPMRATDFAGYSDLIGRLASEAKVTPTHAIGALSTEERLLAFLRAGIESDAGASASTATAAPAPKGARGYWTDARARDAAEYVRDIVYGGPDGLAYTRSIAEFVTGPASASAPNGDLSKLPLGMTLPEWVLRTTITSMTHGRLQLLANVAKRLMAPHDPASASNISASVQTQIDTSATLFPHLTLLLLAMRQILTQPIDLAHLLKSPEELLGVHISPTTTSAGPNSGINTGQKRKRDDEDKGEDKVKQEGDEMKLDLSAMDVDLGAETEVKSEDIAAATTAVKPRRAPDFASIDEFRTALRASGDAIVALEQKRAHNASAKVPKIAGSPVDQDLLEELRLGLLRLARAVPVDQLAKLPPELVPPEIRHIVPTRT